MTPDVVVDVGNSRIKWGRCVGGAITQSASLMPDDANAWQQQLTTWQIVKPAHWVVTGVHPKRRDQLTEWLRQQGHTVRLLNDPKELAIKVLLDRPDHVGIDRLLDALAANQRRESGRPAIIIDAGSAVTVDLVDGDGAFAGGVIMPGLRLMSKALHDYTALLPLVDPQSAHRRCPPSRRAARSKRGFTPVSSAAFAMSSNNIIRLMASRCGSS